MVIMLRILNMLNFTIEKLGEIEQIVDDFRLELEDVSRNIEGLIEFHAEVK